MNGLHRCLESHYAMLFAGILKQTVYYCDNENCNRYGLLAVQLTELHA